MHQSPTFVFCGTPRFAVPTLEVLVQAGLQVRLVVTQPDKPRGRGLALAPSPVKESALALQLPVAQPASIKNNDEFRAQPRHNHRGRLWPHHSAVDDRFAAPWQHQPARVPVTQVSWGRSYTMGDRSG